MANAVDPNSGFCSKTMMFHSLRPPVPLPPEPAPVSLTDFIFSLFNSSPPSPTAAAIIDADTRRRVLYPELVFRLENLASSLRAQFGLSKGDCALVFSPNNIYTPILYLSLFSLGVVISPINPSATVPEIQHQIRLSKPVIAFASSDSAHKLPLLKHGIVNIDSVEFESLMETQRGKKERAVIKVKQSDVATILYSSGTTGPVKGVALTHRNWTANIAGGMRPVRTIQTVGYCTVPLFHAYGMVLSLKLMASGECLVITGGNRRFDMRKMYSVIEEYRVSQLALAPPLVVTMAGDAEVMDGYDLSSLEVVIGGELSYGLTETTGRVFATLGPDETRTEGATGKLMGIVKPKWWILKPGSFGSGALVMKGYVDDEEATIAVLDRGGWLRTGDLCYINNQGYLFFVDRIQELIKYKGYQDHSSFTFKGIFKKIMVMDWALMEQVAPAELEHLLNGQVPVAFVVKQPGNNIDGSEIKDFVAKQVSHYKRIQRVIFIDWLPRNASGKVLRKELVIKLSTPTPSCKFLTLFTFLYYIYFYLYPLNLHIKRKICHLYCCRNLLQYVYLHIV
ncbi:hypothetical protein CXB51_001649 [Gossypium anomalum]|uniref:AMP-dependent synthetase/ligase domain-containing protein n=1 Tax=Gossypium anomalum TaxID=47600 RepID=A0A8J6D9S1_9ROSI|nr:hypothetical protein CXB51_001649 [Gossypium anomalum]